PERRGAAARARRRPRRGERRHADLRPPSAPRVRALDRRRAGRLRPPPGDVPAARRALEAPGPWILKKCRFQETLSIDLPHPRRVAMSDSAPVSPPPSPQRLRLAELYSRLISLAGRDHISSGYLDQ